MIRIAVCDDDMNIAKSICQYLEAKAEQIQDEKLDISFYQSGVSFLYDIELGEKFHIIFMDIEMEGMNGVEVGQVLRNKPGGDDMIIIYVSSYDSYFEGLVEIGSFSFLKKPIDENKLDHVFSRALNKAIKYKNVESKPSLFSFKVGSGNVSVKTDEIVYMKNTKRTIAIYIWDNVNKTINALDHFYSKVNDALNQLPKRQFVRCERSYIVNLDYVYRMNSDSFTLIDKNETRIPISRVHKEVTRTAYFKHRDD